MATTKTFGSGLALGVIATTALGMIAMQPQQRGNQQRGQQDRQPQRGAFQGQSHFTQSDDGRTVYIWQFDRGSGELRHVGTSTVGRDSVRVDDRPAQDRDGNRPDEDERDDDRDDADDRPQQGQQGQGRGRGGRPGDG
ncbi:MAG: hypothetical protein RIB60_06885 [Phycisphaerales bacterium]